MSVRSHGALVALLVSFVMSLISFADLPEASACIAEPELVYITNFFPAEDAKDVPLDATIRLRWMSAEPVFEPLVTAYAFGLPRVEFIEVINQSTGEYVALEQAPSSDELVYAPVEPLSPNTSYKVSLLIPARSGTNRELSWTFETGEQAQAPPEMAAPFGGIGEVRLGEVAVESHTCCPIEYPGECPRCWQTGWERYPLSVLTFDVAEGEAAERYRYLLFRHPEGDPNTSQFVGVFDVRQPGPQRIELRDAQRTYCYSIDRVSEVPRDTLIASGAVVKCANEADRTTIERLPPYEPRPEQCADTSEGDADMGFDMEIPPEQEEQNPEEDEFKDELPWGSETPSTSEGGCGCEAAGGPAQGVGSLLLLALGLVGLRRRTTASLRAR